jgi:two-component system response regulator MprA
MPARAPHDGEPSQPTVLVIDDDRVICMVLREALESAGIRVEACSDPEEGLAAAVANAPDVVVLDVMLPRVDGLAVLQRLRIAGVRSRVLVFSATGSRHAEYARDLGADGYIAKPFDVAEMIATVQALVDAPPRAA